MEFTLETMKFIEGSIVKLLKEDLPIRMSYKLSKFYDVLSKEMTKVEELRQQLVKRYGEEVEGTIKVTTENLEVFNKEYGDLMREAITVEFDPIDVNQIISYSERLEEMGKPAISLSAVDISQLKSVNLLKESQGE